MAVNTTRRTYPGKGIVHFENFKRVERHHWQYESPFQPKTYDLYLIQKEDGKYYWNCNCADARKISHPCGKPCKHETALAQMLKSQYEQKCMAEIQAEEIAAEAESQAEQKHGQAEEITALRAEVAALRCQLDAIKSQPAAITPDLAAIMQEIEKLHKENEQIKVENAEIKRALATKATARKKHQSETEAAQIKQDINIYLDDAVESAKAAIYAAEATRERLASLEAIPHELKAELDAWTERGCEELQPGYKAPDYHAEELTKEMRENGAKSVKQINRETREMSASERAKLLRANRELRDRAPLNGNQGFSFLK